MFPELIRPLLFLCFASCREPGLKFKKKKKKKPEPVISTGVCLLLLPVPAPEVSRESIQQLQKDRLF